MIQDVIVKEADKKGKGVFALRSFKKGEFIFRSKKGRIIHRKDFPQISKDDRMHLSEVDYSTYEIMRVPEKFLNHSCDPNAISKGRSLFALRFIKKGEEITADYRSNAFDKNKWKCYCGSKNCKGWCISDFFTIPEELQKRYLPYTIKVIREEYKRRHKKILRMKPKAIFFDVDGTIIPLKVVVKTFQETCRHFNIKVLSDKKLLDTIVGYKLEEVIPKIIPKAIPIEKEFIRYFEGHQIKNFKKYGKPLPHVKTIFREIKRRKIKIGIVTTKKRSEALAILSGYNLQYNELVGGDDVKKRKPSPEPTLKACKNLKLKPKDCIFVGDHPFDMLSAKGAGCLAVGVLTGWGNRYKLKKAGADHIIKDLRGLKELIK